MTATLAVFSANVQHVLPRDGISTDHACAQCLLSECLSVKESRDRSNIPMFK